MRKAHFRLGHGGPLTNCQSLKNQWLAKFPQPTFILIGDAVFIASFANDPAPHHQTRETTMKLRISSCATALALSSTCAMALPAAVLRLPLVARQPPVQRTLTAHPFLRPPKFHAKSVRGRSQRFTERVNIDSHRSRLGHEEVREKPRIYAGLF
jgi:hypothetical protein